MDTYFNVNHKCIDCYKCISSCPESFIQRFSCLDKTGTEKYAYYDRAYEYVPCHHCNGFFEKGVKTECQLACPVDAIELSRW